MPAGRNARPNTAPTCSSRRASVGSWSIRARTVAWTVSGSVARACSTSTVASPAGPTRSVIERTISPAKNGFPSARLTTAATSSGEADSSRLRTSLPTASSSSGSSASERWFRWPAPHVGRRSRSSGRVSTMISRARSRCGAMMCSTRSSRLSLDQCRSSKTRISGSRAADS
jgi:hypothetical protein